MKQVRWLLLVVVAGTALVASSAAPTAVGVDTTALRDAVTVSGIMDHEEAFQAIADASDDTRAVGTSGFDDSVEYVAGLLDGAGYDVTVQDFSYELFADLTPPEFVRTLPDPDKPYVNGFDQDFVTMEWSGSDSVDDAPLVPVGPILIPSPGGATSGCDPAHFTGFPAGAVALIQRGTCAFRVKVDNAVAAGAAGVVIFNEGNPGDDRQGVVNGTLDPPATQASIPVIGTSFAVGEELYELAQEEDVEVHLEVNAGFVEKHSANVIADTTTGRKDRTVLLGGHLDSVPEGPGINDNGSGTATILEIALQLAELEVKPVNRVRFAFWGAEEEGLFGSQHYVDALTKSERKGIMLNLNLDMVGSPNFVRFVYDGDGSAFGVDGPSGSGTIEDVFDEYFGGQGLATEPTAFDGRSDYFAFINAGIPAGGLFTGAEGIKTAEEAAIYGGTAGVAYDPCYHLACDTLANLSSTALGQMSDATAHATFLFAMTKSSVNGTDNAANSAKENMEFKASLATK